MPLNKSKTAYVCQACGGKFSKWQGQCPNCGGWNTLVETLLTPSEAKKPTYRPGVAKISKLSEYTENSYKRISSGIPEFDQVIGGGFVPGQVVLLSGEPGVGKSTLLLQLASLLGASGKTILYSSGEESASQIASRAARLGIKTETISILEESDVDLIVTTAESVSNIGLLITDSIQVITTSELEGTAGSVGQVRECASRLSRYAKEKHVPLILVGHVTKDGSIAGPKVLEHLVDTVLYLEGDKSHTFRLLSATKNRYGPVGEVGVFEMVEKGMLGVKNPSDRFLEERLKGAPGSIVTVILEGARPVLLEIQALVVKTDFGYPRRTANGFPLSRLLVLTAVLQSRVGINLSDKDIYINVSAGVKILEPSADLAVCLAIASALKNLPLSDKAYAFGEVGLNGEIRRVSQMERRSKEALGMGFADEISPETVRTVREAIARHLK